MITPDQIDVKQEYIDAYVNTYRGHGSGPLNIPGDGIASLLAYIENSSSDWRRGMFLKPDPGLPKKVKALLTNLESVQGWDANQRIRDAYELGLKNGGSK